LAVVFLLVGAASARRLPTTPPRDGDSYYRITHELLGTVVSNAWETCVPEDKTVDLLKLRTAQAKYGMGYRWVRHANASQGWAALVENPMDIDDMVPQLNVPLWGNDCRDQPPGRLKWWCDLYSNPDSLWEPLGDLLMEQIWHLDVFGPGGAGWSWKPGQPQEDLNNKWTGEYFDNTGIFANPVSSGRCGGSLSDYEITEAWASYAYHTAATYGSHITPPDPGQGGLPLLYFERWMILNEPFMRGFYPWNIVEIFRIARDEIVRAYAGSGLDTGVIYIGGVSGGKGPLEGDHRPVPMSPLERHFALAAYGSIHDDTGALLNQSLGVHIFAPGPPESSFSQLRGSGLIDKCNSIFSLGRFWGMDPVRVTIDEAAVMADRQWGLPNPAETQANYLERTLLLALSTGYLEAIHLSVTDHCDGDGHVADRPGVMGHAATDTLKPGYFAGEVYDQVMGNAAFESSFDLPESFYGLRFRTISSGDTTIAAFWSDDPRYDSESIRADTLWVQADNGTLFERFYRVPSDPEDPLPGVCKENERLPSNPGAMQSEQVYPEYDEESDRWWVKVPVSGAPIYYRSATNHLRGAQDRFDATTLAGLRTVGSPETHDIFEFTLTIEEPKGRHDTLDVILPDDWISPQRDSAELPGYVTIDGASYTLQDPAQHLDYSIVGDTIRIVPIDTLLAGSQLSILYGDCRAQSTLLDMGPWKSGPVDLDYLKMENWMTADAIFDYDERPEKESPAYRVPPRAGWKVAPNDADVLTSDEMQVLPYFQHDESSIYRDFCGMVFADSTTGDPHKMIRPLLLRLDPFTEYEIRVYLNNPNDRYFEECEPSMDPWQNDPECPKCREVEVGQTTEWRCLPRMVDQRVRVLPGGIWRDSSVDRTWVVCTGADGEVTIQFRHGGDNDPDPPELLDNLVYCYGVEVRPRGVGGGPLPACQSGTSWIQYQVNRQLVGGAAFDVVADAGVPVNLCDSPE
jgi:hypothetical protein